MKLRRRTRVLDFFRHLFMLNIFEKTLVSLLVPQAPRWVFKLVPPAYLYPKGSMRQVKRDEIMMELDISRLLDHTIYFFRLRDPAWENLFNCTKPNFSVLDIGANIGYVTLRLAQACPEGNVYSFEPDSDTSKSLSKNIKLNSFDNISVYQFALGEKPERALLYKYDILNPAANRILAQKPSENSLSEWVNVITLDQFMIEEKLSRIDLIKIDVEGWELMVLKGGERLIEKWHPILFVELAEVNLNQQGHTAAMLVKYIRGLGYNVRDAKSLQEINEAQENINIDIICMCTKSNEAMLFR